MSRRALAATLMTVGLGSLCLFPFGVKPTDAQAPPAQSPSARVTGGRYQMVGIGSGNGYIIVIDTETGHCWSKPPHLAGQPWLDLSSPVQPK
ncbi:hypothetical protein TA3x_002305 [Tundrisphaera sp. TA3]|uniref:hypothetical protein n=1 Tax=Tundrisphaera sp. TA3 TaxID=3435775 RepID=UPI003EB8FE43